MNQKSYLRVLAVLALTVILVSSGIGCIGEAAGLTAKREPTLQLERIDPQIEQVDREDSLRAELRPAITNFLPIRPVLPPVEPEEPEEPKEPLPESYCMRDEYIVFAQHQDKNGYCWNFASTMAASTTIMKATNEYYDFSELWTGVVLATQSYYSKPGAGGSFSYQNKAIQIGGLMLESDLPYHHSYITSKENVDAYYDYYSRYSNDDLASLLVSSTYQRSNVEEIKRHIMENGSLYLAFSFRTGFLEEDGAYSLTPNQKNTTSNHAISVIGWDDNYEKEFYLDGSDTPTVFKGAWIVLNSYTETNGTDGISRIFYEDTNIYNINGYRFEKDTTKKLYFYDKIESGYAYPIDVKGKYCGDRVAESGVSKQLNIFYSDVSLEYSYEISEGAAIRDIEIYLDNKDVTDAFSVRIDEAEKRFYIERKNADYGNYKVLVRYADNQASDTYLNNFFVTHGLVGEELEFDNASNKLAFNTGREIEYYSYSSSEKSYVVYTNTLSGKLSFLPIGQSIYSEKNMSIPSLSYEITDGKSCTVSYTITANSGYRLVYTFTVVYCADTAMQPVWVYYDLAGGENHAENLDRELAGEEGGLVLYEPTREGYAFAGWYIEWDGGSIAVPKDGDAYRVAWELIHHMGESPGLYATSYYTKYYNNTSLLFLRAAWERIECTVTWLGSDGEVLLEESRPCGEVPVYRGETPTRAEDARYTYTFIGWSPIGVLSGDATYTALFQKTPKQYLVTVLTPENGTVTSAQSGAITCLDSRTYIFTPRDGYRVKDVKVNGVSVGALTSYTFDDVCEDQTVCVEFERAENPAVLITLAIAVIPMIATLMLVFILLKKRRF